MTYLGLQAFNPHQQSLYHCGCVVHCHFLRKAGVVWSNTVKGPLGDQTIQDPIVVGEPPRTIFMPTCRLHTYDEEEVSEVDIVCRVTVPSVTEGSIHTSHQCLGS